MSNRRASSNRIRGPQSALTDFLAANNISAAQISAGYERRQAEARQREEQEAAERGEDSAKNGEKGDESDERIKSVVNKRKRKRQFEKTAANFNAGKNVKGRKNPMANNSDDEDIGWDMYTKRKSLPGQLENCECCEKRFTVTPYSRTGRSGGLLCSKCSKEQEAMKKKDDKAKRLSGGRERRRQIQSKLLDGVVQIGCRSLLELCVKEVADNINDVDEFGDLPESLLQRLSQILSRRRVITSRSLDLFLRPDLATIDIYDCGKLECEDYVKLFQVVPRVQSINLQNAGQFKDEVLNFMIERDVPIKHLQIEAANLVSNTKWIEYFKKCGHRLETVKLSWLDNSMDDDAFSTLVRSCPNLKRLKLKKCFKLSGAALESMTELTTLEHLSLCFNVPTSSQMLAELISVVGPNLRTLSLEGFTEADDHILVAIRSHCIKLRKLRFTDNDYCTDAGFVALFSEWPNPPLAMVDLSSNRSIDYSAPDGPVDPVGFASAGFNAMMKHSGTAIEKLDVSSCRHIGFNIFSRIFDGQLQYPLLKDINISFLPKIDTSVCAGILKSCPHLTKVTAFGCFNVTDIAVPKGIALIGLPHSQESLVQESDSGTGLWLFEQQFNTSGLSKL